MNYYQRYGGDYARDTGHLSLAEHGAYTLLLDVQYSTESGLPQSVEALCRICRAMGKAEQAAVRAVADAYFPLAEDGLRWNPRAFRDIAKARRRITAAKTNGASRWHPTGIPLGSSPHAQPESHAGEASPAPAPDSKDQNLNPNVEFGEKPPPKLDVVPLVINPEKPPRLQAEAAELLAFLNERTQRHFRPTMTTLRPVMARLKEGYTLSECRAVVARKVRQWSSDDKMRDYLRPATLFGAEKFAQYVVEVPPPEEIVDVV